MARASLGVARLLLLFCAGLAYGAEPWMVGAPTFPCDLLFVKGKKVAGTTVGGIVRRMGETFGISFFSPEVPRTKAQAWRSGGREKWILEQFDDFASKASAKKIGWAQEQTLSPRRAGLRNTSQALERLAQRALRLTVVREPMEHALSACTHFGPCGHAPAPNASKVSKSAPADGARRRLAAAASTEAKMDWIKKSMGVSQMWRFITPTPDAEIDDGSPEALKARTSPVDDFYHAVLLADDLDTSLVALAASVELLSLDDVLYIAAKTTHTARRPAVQRQPADFLVELRALFYGSHAVAGRAPDTDVYAAARARLDATVDGIGKAQFAKMLDTFQRRQALMVAACRTGASLKALKGGAALPGGLAARRARECLYGDQGCGHRCIDAWVRANPLEDTAAPRPDRSAAAAAPAAAKKRHRRQRPE